MFIAEVEPMENAAKLKRKGVEKKEAQALSITREGEEKETLSYAKKERRSGRGSIFRGL